MQTWRHITHELSTQTEYTETQAGRHAPGQGWQLRRPERARGGHHAGRYKQEGGQLLRARRRGLDRPLQNPLVASFLFEPLNPPPSQHWPFSETLTGASQDHAGWQENDAGDGGARDGGALLCLLLLVTLQNENCTQREGLKKLGCPGHPGSMWDTLTLGCASLAADRI